MNIKRSLCSALMLLTALLIAPTAMGTAITEAAQLRGSDSAAGDNFGISLAIRDDTLVIGAFANYSASYHAGAIYVFGRDGGSWTERAKLVHSDAAPGDNLGVSVAISGDTVIAGANDKALGGDNKVGAAYVFVDDAGTWFQQAKLIAPDPAASDRFGSAVLIEGDTAVIGAIWDDDLGPDSGSVHVFQRVGTVWTHEAKLTASDGAAGDWFGQVLALDGDTIMVGSYLDDDRGPDSGSVYVFTWNGSMWIEQAKLLATDGDPSDTFGDSVALQGDTAVIGASGDDEFGTSAGAAYVFKHTGAGWVETTKLTAAAAAPHDSFGYRVALDGNAALVSAHGHQLDRAGVAHVFTESNSGWTEVGTLAGSDVTSASYFATRLALHGHTALAWHQDSTGSGYVFEVGSLIAPVYSCAGFEAPMHREEPVTVRQQRALPLKVQLLDEADVPLTDTTIDSPPILQVLFAAGSGADPVDVTNEALWVGEGSDGNAFEFSGSQKWQFNLKSTNFTAPGTYLLYVLPGGNYILDPTCEAAFMVE